MWLKNNHKICQYLPILEEIYRPDHFEYLSGRTIHNKIPIHR